MEDDIYLENINYPNKLIISFTYSHNTDFVCFIDYNKTNCYYKKESEDTFSKISYNFNNNCSELKSFYYEETDEFILSCKVSYDYNLYIFNANDMTNNIKEKKLSISGYNGKLSIIYNKKINDYNIIYDYNFTLTCEEFNVEEDLYYIDSTNINKIISTTEINYKNINSLMNDTIINNFINNISFISNYNNSKFLNKSIGEIIKDLIDEKINITEINEGKVYYITKDRLNFSFSTTNIQTIKINKNETTIILGKCEDKLKDYYNISNNSNLYILKIDISQKYTKIPKVEYEIYYPLNNSKLEKLNLSICENINIELFIPVNITDNVEKYNPFSDYYNDICSKTTTEVGTDITLKDRQNEFIDTNLSLCENNCKFIYYDVDNKKVKCECRIKTFLSVINEIQFDKNELMKNFKKMHNIANIKIINCFKIIFKKDNLLNNYGFYILVFLLVIFIICSILFCCKYYQIIINEIDEIIQAKKIWRRKILQMQTNHKIIK